MKGRKRLLLSVGPVLVAILVVALLFFLPLRLPKTSAEKLTRAATSMSVNVLKGNSLKKEALAEKNYLPLFGSSELSRLNSFHPSVLAEKYERSYRPFLLGAAGSQSLAHFLMLHSLKEELRGEKIVFIISPQWFVEGGVNQGMFSLYYSPLQTYQWLVDLEEVEPRDQYLAKRLLDFENLEKETTLRQWLTRIQAGQLLTAQQKNLAALRLQVYQREDELFSHLKISNKEKKIKKAAQLLPSAFQEKELYSLADKLGAEKTTNNPYQISNSFYTKRIYPVEKRLKNSQQDYNYLNSVEFSDFQLFLTEAARLELDVLFVIPPVNQKWADYTGLSPTMLDQFSQKITYQLKEQGFDQILDFTQERSTSYFMEDTIHLGWRGWLAVDKGLQPFLKSHHSPSYLLDEQFFSPAWQKELPKK